MKRAAVKKHSDGSVTVLDPRRFASKIGTCACGADAYVARPAVPGDFSNWLQECYACSDKNSEKKDNGTG